MSAKKFNPHSRLEINMANVKLKQIRKSYWKISSETIDKKIRRATNVVPPLFLNKWCSPANSSVTSHNIHQTWEAVFWNCSLWLGAERQAHDLFLKWCSKACICGNKPNQTKNMRSYFCLAVLITWCRAAFSQPLIHGVPEVTSSEISRNFTKKPSKSQTDKSAFQMALQLHCLFF